MPATDDTLTTADGRPEAFEPSSSSARALAPLIRVNAVCPGYIDTPWWNERGKEAADKQRETAKARMPLKVASTPADIAELVTFLASPASRHMTGEYIRIDAGGHL